MSITSVADQLGRRASDQVAAKNAIDIALIDARLKQQEDETARNRSFRHETNQTLQKLVTNTENMAGDIKALRELSGRLSEVEQSQATHTVKCDERYERIEEYMDDSKRDREAIKVKQEATDKKINDGSNRVLLALLVATVSIIAALLWRFGLPPMGN
jgi:hypothetical protein